MNQPTYQPTYFPIGVRHVKTKNISILQIPLYVSLRKGWLVGWLVVIVIMTVEKFKNLVQNWRFLEIFENDLRIINQPTFWLEYGTGWLVG